MGSIFCDIKRKIRVKKKVFYTFVNHVCTYLNLLCVCECVRAYVFLCRFSFFSSSVFGIVSAAVT